MPTSVDEYKSECLRIVRSFLSHKGFEQLEDDGRNIVVYDPEEREVAIIEVLPQYDLRDAAVPDLKVADDDMKRFRRAVWAWLAEHDGEVPSAQGVRHDVISVGLIGEDQARVRHMVRAWGVDVAA